MPTDDLPGQRFVLPRWPRYVLIAFIAESLLLAGLRLADVNPFVVLLLVFLWVPTVIAAAALALYLGAWMLNRSSSRAK